MVFGGPGVGGSGVLNLSSLTGANGFKLDGENNNDFSGWSVSAAGDINGDGVDGFDHRGVWLSSNTIRVAAMWCLADWEWAAVEY